MYLYLNGINVQFITKLIINWNNLQVYMVVVISTDTRTKFHRFKFCLYHPLNCLIFGWLPQHSVPQFSLLLHGENYMTTSEGFCDVKNN